MVSSQKRRALKGAARQSRVWLDDSIGMSPNKYREMIQEALEGLEREGLIYNTGRSRNGQVVYAAMPTLKERN